VHCYLYTSSPTIDKHGDWEDAEANGWTLLDGGMHSAHEGVSVNHYHAHLENDWLENAGHSHNGQGCGPDN
jgi:hypothetical protein